MCQQFQTRGLPVTLGQLRLRRSLTFWGGGGGGFTIPALLGWVSCKFEVWCRVAYNHVVGEFVGGCFNRSAGTTAG